VLDRNAHRARHRLGARASEVGRDLNRGWHNLRVLGYRQAIKANSAKQNRDDRDHVGKNRSLNEESRHALV